LEKRNIFSQKRNIIDTIKANLSFMSTTVKEIGQTANPSPFLGFGFEGFFPAYFAWHQEGKS
jgi:hypothetical protein